MKRWTSSEDKILQRYHSKLRSAHRRDAALETLSRLLPGRNRQMIFWRARQIGLRAKKRWTEEEDALLRLKWAEGAAITIRRALPQRTWSQIQGRASRLGLEGRWQGFVTISAAAEKLGYHLTTFIKILKATEVTICFRAQRNVGGGITGKHRVVEWDTAVEAVDAWMEMETPKDISVRTGIPTATLLHWLKKEGASKGAGVAVRLSREEADALVERHRSVWEIRQRTRKKETTDGQQLHAVQRSDRQPHG